MLEKFFAVVGCNDDQRVFPIAGLLKMSKQPPQFGIHLPDTADIEIDQVLDIALAEGEVVISKRHQLTRRACDFALVGSAQVLLVFRLRGVVAVRLIVVKKEKKTLGFLGCEPLDDSFCHAGALESDILLHVLILVEALIESLVFGEKE